MSKPKLNSYGKTMKGQFKPKNPGKYLGDVKNIIYRSQWEFAYMVRLDSNPDVLQWNSETVVVPYVSPKDRKAHRYYLDFWVRMKTKDGIQEYIIEIKPHSQVVPPVRGKKRQTTYLKECMTHAINTAKWHSATQWAKERGMKFLILTEKSLFGKE